MFYIVADPAAVLFTLYCGLPGAPPEKGIKSVRGQSVSADTVSTFKENVTADLVDGHIHINIMITKGMVNTNKEKRNG